MITVFLHHNSVQNLIGKFKMGQPVTQTKKLPDTRIKMLYHSSFFKDADQLLVHLQAAVNEKLVDFSQKIVS